MLPASTGSGESDLVSARSAEVLTVVSSVAVLSEVSGSNTPEVVLAVLEMLLHREDAILTRRLLEFLPVLLISVRFHPTTPAVRVPPPVAETKLVPAGIASDRLTPGSEDDTSNSTHSQKAYAFSSCNETGESDLVSARLAEGLPVVSSAAALS